ncbi:MAG TPA: hypothetical protein VN840_17605 [Streptosporangiaceae bacterium]|nr:hypothetical protein [Streptosporangiaceae bacterium]
MRRLLSAHRPSALTALVIGAVLSLAGPMAAQGQVTTGTAVPRTASTGVRPGPIGGLDCNGLSPIQRPAKPGLQCADPHGSDGGRFVDNGYYIGHDEPSVRFLSSVPGSGSDTTMTERLPMDPALAPTVAHPGKDVTHWVELSIAPWISTDVCDPQSAPLLPCTPRSDANAPHGRYPGGGAAFVELQFYPPGFAPFADSISCDNTHWCSALNIDSLECSGNGSGPCNPNCVEPVNFAFIQTNGVPTGPPSPQLSDLATNTPNSHTLLMNPGDKITIHMFDARIPGGHALEVIESDLTTGKSGFMIASGANGFMNTNPFDCTGTKFNFQPEYSTARAQNIIPWGIGPYMINNQFEIGHFEPCTSLSGPAKITIGSFTDTYFKHCAGPYESAADTGKSFEPDDAPCYPAGDTHGGTVQPNIVTGCDVFFDAIGDLDYDGTPYYPDWPNSLTAGRFPSPFLQQQPTTVGGRRYSAIQFMTDSSATQFNTNCNLETGSGCVLPPKGPGHFYPFWTLAKVGGRCVWEFGNMRNGNSYGGDAQYGRVGPGTIGAFVGPILRNPRSC